MILSWDVEAFVLKVKPRYSKGLRAIFSRIFFKTKNSPFRTKKTPHRVIGASAAARKSKGKPPLYPPQGGNRQKAKVLIGKALMIFALVGYFRRAALAAKNQQEG